jgi:hypothetical protein
MVISYIHSKCWRMKLVFYERQQYSASAGRRCRTMLFWTDTGERKVFGLEVLQEAEKPVRMVRDNV